MEPQISDGLITDDPLLPIGPVCESHVELVRGISQLCTNLKWVVRLGFVFVPVFVGFMLFSLSQITDLRQVMAVYNNRLDTVSEIVRENTKILRQLEMEQGKLQDLCNREFKDKGRDK